MQHQHQLPSSDESRTITEEKHQFKRQSFLIPTVCVYCDNRVWTGLKRSAFQCQKCGDAIHKKCLKIGEGNWGVCKPSDITRKPKKTPKDSKETKDSRDFKEQKEGPKKSSPRDPSSHSFTLLEAVVNDDLEQVLELLKTANEEVLNARGKHGLSILHFAVQSPNEKILIALLSRKEISVNVTNENLETPLHYFCQKFASPNCEKPFKLFLAKGANINAPNAHGETPLFKAIFNEHVRLLIIQLLLEHGAAVNAANVNGDTALHYAVRLGREDLVQVLLAFGADLNIQGAQRQTPIDIAEESGDVVLLKYLKGVKDMILWLKGIGLLKYKRQFIMSGLTKAKCLEMTGHALCEKVGIVDEEDRNTLKRALRRLQNQEKTSPMKKSASIKPIKKTGAVEKSNSMSSGEKTALEVLRDQLTDEQIILAEELEYTRFISKGASAKVWQGLYQGKPVALKVLRGKMDEEKLETFKKEFAIVSQIHSEYVVKFYGLCLEPKLTLVIEYCSRGSLYDVMNDPTIEIGWPMVFKFATDMAKGLQVLHNHKPKILHRDWKSLNLLVTEDWCIKVCDFGLSRPDTNSNNETLIKLRGTMTYCSPEVYQGSKFNEKSDIYAIGIVLWELVNRCIKGKYERPYSEFPHITYEYQIILQAAKQGLRPTIPPCPEPMAKLIAECWAQDPNQRPTADILLQRLQAMQLEYEKDPRRWDITIIPKFPPPPPPLVFANDPSTKGPKDTVDTSDSEDSELVYPKPKRLSQEVKILKRQQSVPKTPPSLPSKSPTSSPLSRLTSHSESPQSTKQTIHRTLSSDNGQSFPKRSVTPPPSPHSGSRPSSPRPALPKTPSGRLKLQITLSQESESDKTQPQYIVYTSQVQSEILLYEPSSTVASSKEPVPSSMNGSSIPIATIEQELTIVDRRPQNPESETTEATPQSSPQNVNETVSLDSHSPTEQTIEKESLSVLDEQQPPVTSDKNISSLPAQSPSVNDKDKEKHEQVGSASSLSSPHSSSTSPHESSPTSPSSSSNIDGEIHLSTSPEPRRHRSEILSRKKQVSSTQLKQKGKPTKSEPLLHHTSQIKHEKSEETTHKTVKDKDRDKDKDKDKERDKDKDKDKERDKDKTKETKEKRKSKERRQSRKKGSK